MLKRIPLVLAAALVAFACTDTVTQPDVEDSGTIASTESALGLHDAVLPPGEGVQQYIMALDPALDGRSIKGTYAFTGPGDDVNVPVGSFATLGFGIAFTNLTDDPTDPIPLTPDQIQALIIPFVTDINYQIFFDGVQIPANDPEIGWRWEASGWFPTNPAVCLEVYGQEECYRLQARYAYYVVPQKPGAYDLMSCNDFGGCNSKWVIWDK